MESFALGQISGDPFGRPAVAFQFLGDPVNAGLGIDKDKHPVPFFFIQHPQKQGKFLIFADMIQTLLNALDGHGFRGDGDKLRQVHVFIGKFHDPVGQGG